MRLMVWDLGLGKQDSSTWSPWRRWEASQDPEGLKAKSVKALQDPGMHWETWEALRTRSNFFWGGRAAAQKERCSECHRAPTSSRLLGFVTVRYMETRIHHLGNWRPRGI